MARAARDDEASDNGKEEEEEEAATATTAGGGVDCLYGGRRTMNNKRCDVTLDFRSARDQPGRVGGDSAVPCNRSGTGIAMKPTRHTFTSVASIPSHALFASLLAAN